MIWSLAPFLFLGFPSTTAVGHCKPSGDYPGTVVLDSPIGMPQDQRYVVVVLPVQKAKGYRPITCGEIDLKYVLVVEALLFARRTLTDRFPDAETLGIMVLDSCGHSDGTIRDIVNFETCTLHFGTPTLKVSPDQVLSYLSMGSELFNSKVRTALAAFEKPVLSLALPHFGIQWPETFREASSSFPITALVQLLEKLGLYYVSVMYSTAPYSIELYRRFKTMAIASSICFEAFTLSSASNQTALQSIVTSLAKKSDIRIIVVLLDSETTVKVLAAANLVQKLDRFYWIGMSSSLSSLEVPRLLPRKNLFLSKQANLEKFRELFLGKSKRYFGLEENLWLYKYLGCKRSQEWLCRQKIEELPTYWQRQTEMIDRIVEIYDLMALASQDLLKGGTVNSTFQFATKLAHAQEQLSGQDQGEIKVISYTRSTTPSFAGSKVAWSTNELGTVRLEEPLELEEDQPLPEAAYCKSNCSWCPKKATRRRPEDEARVETLGPAPFWAPIIHRAQPWAYILSGMGILVILAVTGFELASVRKICNNMLKLAPLGRSGIVLGQGLLMGILFLAASLFTFTVHPSPALCAIQRFALSLSLVLCFGSLLTKLLVLVSFSQSQLLGCAYQVVLLILLLLIQTAVDVQWLLYEPPRLKGMVGPCGSCRLETEDYIKGLSFPLFLLALSSFIAIAIRRNPFNDGEASFIAFTSTALLIAWVGYISAISIYGSETMVCVTSGYCVSFNCIVLLLVMFLPPSRQRVACGRIFNEGSLGRRRKSYSGGAYSGNPAGQNTGLHSDSTSPSSVGTHGTNLSEIFPKHVPQNSDPEWNEDVSFQEQWPPPPSSMGLPNMYYEGVPGDMGSQDTLDIPKEEKLTVRSVSRHPSGATHKPTLRHHPKCRSLNQPAMPCPRSAARIVIAVTFGTSQDVRLIGNRGLSLADLRDGDIVQLKRPASRGLDVGNLLIHQRELSKSLRGIPRTTMSAVQKATPNTVRSHSHLDSKSLFVKIDEDLERDLNRSRSSPDLARQRRYSSREKSHTVRSARRHSHSRARNGIKL